jgi:hypothetical protein
MLKTTVFIVIDGNQTTSYLKEHLFKVDFLSTFLFLEIIIQYRRIHSTW